MSIPWPFFCISHLFKKEQHLWSCFFASHQDCSVVIHESSAVIGPGDDKFAQTTLQLVSEGSSGSVLPGRSAHVAENPCVKSKKTLFVQQ